MNKTILCVFFAVQSLAVFSQSGMTREEAITVQPQGLCNYSDFMTQGTEMWFKFVAQSEKVAIELKSEKFGNNMGHIHNLKLYKGNETTDRAQDELPFNSESDKLKVNLNAGNLVIGETYVLRADRKAHVGECNKAYCRNNNSTNPAQIRLCVQNVNVFIPNDFYGELPAVNGAFELNRGQVANLERQVVNDIVMYSKNTSPQLYLGGHSSSFVWSKIDDDSLTRDTIHRVDMELLNGQLNERILRAEELPGYTNYYLGHNSKGILENKSYARAIRQSVYNNIDVHYYSNQHGLKMYFVINPGGNHQDIKIQFTGGATTELTASGGLKVKSPIGEMVFKKALVYYTNPGENNVPMPQSGNFVDLGNGVYSFEVDNYAPNRILVIQVEKEGITRDSGPIEWSTFLGGASGDVSNDITSDDNENFYIAGTSEGNLFPVGGALIYDESYNGFFDSYLAKFDNQYAKEWATYIGGNLDDYGYKVAHDNVNDVIYFSGATNNDVSTLPVKPFTPNPNAYLSPVGGLYRQFVSRFNGDGIIEWLSYLPQNSNGPVNVNVDNNGNLYCAGSTRLPQSAPNYTCSATPNGDLPFCRTNPNSYLQSQNNGGTDIPPSDIFIMKFTPNLDLVWSTHLGGDGEDHVYDIEIDNAAGFLYLVGITNSQACLSCFPDNTTTEFPIKVIGGYSQTTTAGWDGFVARFSLDGELGWSTFYGGEGADFINDATLMEGQNFVITGFTSTNYYHNVDGQPSNNAGFPTQNTVNGFHQPTFGGGTYDNFVAQFRGATSLLNWSTFIGGGGDELQNLETSGLKADINVRNELFIAGNTDSGSTPTNGSIQPLSNENYYSNDTHSDYDDNATVAHGDVYIVGFDENRNKVWATYFGGKSPDINLNNNNERVTGVVTINERVYITGLAYFEENFPINCPNTINPYCQSSLVWDGTGFDFGDAYIAQLKIGAGFVGLSEAKAEENRGLILFPNPNNGALTLEWSHDLGKIKEIVVTNQVGQVVKVIKSTKQIKQNSCEINISDLTDGIYFVTLSDDYQSFTGKVIKY